MVQGPYGERSRHWATLRYSLNTIKTVINLESAEEDTPAFKMKKCYKKA